MGGKGGSSSDAGVVAAMASAQAADLAYALGEQQFVWSQQVWQQEQPLVDQSEQAQITMYNQMAATQAQATEEAAQQWQQYQTLYAPLEAKFVDQAENWASPENTALVRGQAMGDVAEQGQASLASAAETLRGYGVNPSSPRYASLYLGAQPLLGASEAAAGTSAAQNLKLQQLGLESGAINTGRGLVNAVTGLTTAGTQAGQVGTGAAAGAAGTAQSNLAGTAVGAGATSQLFNAGANNMNSYVNAVNGYNQSQAEFAQSQASEMGGLGSALGGMLGLGFMGKLSDESEKTDIKRQGTSQGGIPLYSFRYKDDPKTYPKVVGPMAQDIARIAPHMVAAIPGSPRGKMMIAYQDGGDVGGPEMIPSDPQLTPTQGGGMSGQPGAAMPPAQTPPGGTPGGGVPTTASPSMGQQSDDVPAMLTANEFVIPKDVATWVGHRQLAAQIDKARQEQDKFSQRGDIGGEPTGAIPQQPTFVSRPVQAGLIPGGNAAIPPVATQRAMG
jgi:hypothetical protein